MSTSKSLSNSSENGNELRRGPWTIEEDKMLVQYISDHGEGRWNLLAKRSGLKRIGKSCRLRWLNYLKPDVKRGNLTLEEQLLILELHSRWGNRWSKIAQHLPGRTDNEIKNYWRTRIQKQARQLKIDTYSIEFQELIRHFWIAKLLQKAKESSSSISIQNQTIPMPHGSGPQYSTMPTQNPWQGPCINEAAGPNYLDQHEQNSNSEHNNNGSCISFSESANISNVPNLLGCTTNQFYSIGTNDFGTLTYDGHDETNNVYERDAFNMASTLGDCHMVESNLVNKDFARRKWSIDELF